MFVRVGWCSVIILWTFIGLNVQYLLVTLNLNLNSQPQLYTFPVFRNSRVHDGGLSWFCIAGTPRRCWRRNLLNNWSALAGWLRWRPRQRNTPGLYISKSRARVDDDFSNESFLRKKCWEFWLTFQFKRRFIQILKISYSLTAWDSRRKWKAFSFQN